MMGGSDTVHLKDLDMSNTTFDRPDLSAFTRLDGLGLEVTGQRMWPDRAVLACRIVDEDRWCRRCGCQGVARDTVIRRLAHEPCGWRPTIVHVSVRRYRCQECSHVWRQDMSQAADPRAKLSRTAARWALAGRGRSSSDGGAHRPGSGCVLEEPPTLLSWPKQSAH